ncbi:hypothetical protein PF003_g316 [Phytophthora fragariae]|nr:hypothetical protein PF003_g316 [Phytophthora fragariae]
MGLTAVFPSDARLCTKMSSKYVCTNCRIGLKSCAASRLNVAGALDSPWGMTNHSHNIPLGVLTAVRRMSDSRISS